MKKILLMSAAAVLFCANAAHAEVKLNLTGHIKGYVFYTKQDNPPGGDERSFDILRETEIHFGGETTLDNGLTVGVYNEADIDVADVFKTEKSYAYFSGDWGRVNFGKEEGANYLLQVAAPSADSNYDGVRQYVSGFNGFGTIDYDNDLTTYYTKLTYLTPVLSGFQAGISYTPDTDDFGPVSATSQAIADNLSDETGEYESAWDVGAQYKGKFDDVSYTVGAGYTIVGYEETGPGDPDDDSQEWNICVDTDWKNFGLGVVYTETNLGTDDDEARTWVVGADYKLNKDWKLGASYLNYEEDTSTDDEIDRYTAGGVYTYGPGMTLRGSVSYVDLETNTSDRDGVSLLIGTQINF